MVKLKVSIAVFSPGDNICVKMVGTCHSTEQNRTQESRVMTNKYTSKSGKISCRVANSTDFLKEIYKIDPKN